MVICDEQVGPVRVEEGTDETERSFDGCRRRVQGRFRHTHAVREEGLAHGVARRWLCGFFVT